MNIHNVIKPIAIHEYIFFQYQA